MLGFQPPAIGEEEIAAVADTLRSGWLTTGPRAAELERRMAEYLEAKHVLAFASGTAALHLSLVALGVGPGDEVITTPITWPATANVIVHTGATPVFVDVQDADLNMDPELVAEAVTEQTKAILPVDLAGQPSNLDPLLELGLPVVADLTCFSLYATKNIAAGEGGLIATNRDGIAEALQDLRLMRRGHGSLYDLPVPGYKANLSDVLAAIALCQFDKIGAHAKIRRRQFAAYDAAVADLPGITPLARDDRDVHALHLYVVRIDAQGAGASRDDYMQALKEENIATSIHFLAVHRLTWYRERFPDQASMPVAERASDEVLSLPLSPARDPHGHRRAARGRTDPRHAAADRRRRALQHHRGRRADHGDAVSRRVRQPWRCLRPSRRAEPDEGLSPRGSRAARRRAGLHPPDRIDPGAADRCRG